MFAQTPAPPYYAVIFTFTLKDNDDAYAAMAKRMEELAAQMPGFLGIESARDELGISVSYWESEEAIAQWKAQSEHRIAQEKGKADWYSGFVLRVAKVERDYGFSKA